MALGCTTSVSRSECRDMQLMDNERRPAEADSRRDLHCFISLSPHRPLLHPHHTRVGVQRRAGADGQHQLLLDVTEGEAGEDGDG